MKLSSDGYDRARRFILNRARPLERALLAHGLEGAPPQPVLEALAPFRNEDGGFGHALEPDVRLPGSSVIATTIGLQVLREVEAPADHPFVQGAISYLLETYDKGLGGWRNVGPAVDEFPHAPWWSWSETPDAHWKTNPRAEILGHLYHYATGVSADFLDELTRKTVADIETLLSTEIGADALLCCARLAETAEFPRRAIVARRVCEIGRAMVNRNPEEWGAYVPKPLKLAPLPDSTLARDLASDVTLNLDYEIEHQEPDGSWSPYWSWGDTYPDAWEEAKREWAGDITLRNLKSLRAFGRIQSG